MVIEKSLFGIITVTVLTDFSIHTSNTEHTYNLNHLGLSNAGVSNTKICIYLTKFSKGTFELTDYGIMYNGFKQSFTIEDRAGQSKPVLNFYINTIVSLALLNILVP